MKLTELLIRRIKEKINRWRFERAIPCILKIPPIRLGDAPFTLLSMVHHRDVNAYLLAVKSFTAYLSPRRIVVVTDPSITEADREILKKHVPEIALLRAEDFRDSQLPYGGTWERLIAISDEVKSSYVIQMDADTVTLDYPAEVHQSIQDNCSFMLGTVDGQSLMDCHSMARRAKEQAGPGGHIQIVAESRLDQVEDSSFKKYSRGCSGFSGFSCGSFSRDDLVAFSGRMEGLLGERWREWGSEQFTSNYFVANSHRATVLPHPKYCHPLNEKADTVFLHFIGYVRFLTPRYAEAAREVCRKFGSWMQ